MRRDSVQSAASEQPASRRPRVRAHAPLKVGVVGVGVMGQAHARIYSELPGTELVGVTDHTPAKAEAVATRTRSRAFASLEALLEAGVQALSITVPTDLHAEVAMRCIESGCAVLIEKPITADVAQARAVIDAARSHGTVLMVGHVERFNPAAVALKAALASEQLISIDITRVGPFPPRMSKIGVVIDLAVHDIDLVRWLTGEDIAELHALTRSIKAEREDVALIQMRTPSGILSQINTNWLTPFRVRTIHATTENGYFVADLITRQVSEYRDYKPDGTFTARQLMVGGAEPLRGELEHFVGCVLNARDPDVSGEEGLRNLELALACLQNRDVSRPV
jgi:predicted dehydrogenase